MKNVFVVSFKNHSTDQESIQIYSGKNAAFIGALKVACRYLTIENLKEIQKFILLFEFEKALDLFNQSKQSFSVYLSEYEVLDEPKSEMDKLA